MPRSHASRSMASSASAPALSNAGSGINPRTPNLASQQFKREIAYKEAMDRHINTMEARASEVMNERNAWSQHVNDCMRQEHDEIQDKRQRAQMNLHFLSHQIQLGEEKKREQRKDDIVSASAHDFPKFKETAASEYKQYLQGQQARMRADLDEQVKTNQTLKNLAKQRERALEINQLESNRQEMAMLRKAEREKKAFDREALSTAWNAEIRMKNIWKAIDCHNKVSSHVPQVMNNESGGTPMGSIPPSRGGSSILSSGRLLTGSHAGRRMRMGPDSDVHSHLSQIEERVSTGRSHN